MAVPDDTPSGDHASTTASRDAVIAALQAENAGLCAEIVVLRADNAALTARLAELERRLGLDSSNSGKPPSSDGLKTAAGQQPASTDRQDDRRSGGPSGQDVVPE